MYKYFIFLLIILILQALSQNNQEVSSQPKTETCDASNPESCKNSQKEEKNTKLTYSDLFINQPRPNLNDSSPFEKSLFFDFSINEKIAEVVKQYGMIPYPAERFIGKRQGNFLHFMHLCYEKKLPIFFSADQIIYPYIETTKELQKEIMEKGLYKVLHQFLSKVIDYGKNEKYEQGILLYFSIALKMLDNETTVIHDDVCKKLINNLLTIKNYNATMYNFTLLGNKRSIDKLNFIQIYPILQGSDTLKKISDCLRFLQNFEFKIEKELYTIYRIGSLISKSGQDAVYKEIKTFIKYIFNEDENVLNPLDLYLYLNKNYKNETASNVTINKLYNVIKDEIEKNTSLSFMANYTFANKKEKESYRNQKISHVSLFSYTYTLDEFINYKLLNVYRLRFFPSLFEYIHIAHHGTLMKQLIYDRYKGFNRTNNTKFIRYRDAIDMGEEFNWTKKAVKESINKEKEKWLDSYENSFNYLLNILGHIDKNLNQEMKRGQKIKTFNTLMGSYVHFKRDFLLFMQYSNITYSTNGSLVDVYFDNKKNFYENIQKVTLIFQKKLVGLVNYLDDKNVKIELEQLIENKLKKLFISYENILKAIKIQEKEGENQELRKIKNSMFYYDTKTKQYQGWYVDLYKDKTGEANFNLNMYVNNFYMSRPIFQVKFFGIIIYASMNYPEFGLVAVDTKQKDEKKLYIFSSYTGNEYPRPWGERLNYEWLQKIIFNRNL